MLPLLKFFFKKNSLLRESRKNSSDKGEKGIAKLSSIAPKHGVNHIYQDDHIGDNHNELDSVLMAHQDSGIGRESTVQLPKLKNRYMTDSHIKNINAGA
ncbi:hypothetical protein [Flexibacterium corallicola]|uniref:hypothetical protein n=1 Tax=Flexibacterium corallicola TaxID=3037259 RepID=UPI00286F08D0|nr:hypothetical protein [Pseudovibrio sp. M1P-2-3]